MSERDPREGPEAGPPPEPAAEARRPLRVSLRYTALALFLVTALGPVALATALLVNVNRTAVRDSEEQLQAAVLAEVAGLVLRTVGAARGDAEAVAAALAEAAFGPAGEDQGIEGVRALMATRRSIGAARFEVPTAGVSTLIQRAGEPAVAPPSTPELRRAADERGVGFAVSGPGRGLVVVPIIARERGNSGGAMANPKGYVTAEVNLEGVAADLKDVAEQRFGGSARLLVADGARRAVGSFGVEGSPPGADVAALPVWNALPDGASWSTRVGVVSEFREGGVPMVGAVESVPDLGWAVAIWRPEPVAYAALAQMRERGAMVAAGGALLALLIGLLAARAVITPILTLAAQVRLIGQRRWRDVRLASPRRDEIGELSRSIDRMAQDLEHGEAEVVRQTKLRGDLSRFLSRELVESIVRGDHSLALGGKRAGVSVLFADVVAFTPLAETRPAEEVVALLNELFSMLSEVVFRHGGTVDKFIGDCIMAVWGAPVPHEDHAERALAAAEDMMRFLETANARWSQTYGIEIRLGIGVNSGDAIVGNIGSDKRMEYTVVGDVVNVAARLEAIAAPNQVLVGETTHAMAGDAFAMSLLGERKLTGRQASSRVYTLLTG